MCFFFGSQTIKNGTVNSTGFIKSIRLKQILKMHIVFIYTMMVNIMSFEHAFTEKLYTAQQALHLKKKN